jgi:tetratricopeptide (TPR) repeat protein
VQACPPSAWYRLRKFARRQKRALAMAACVVLAVAGLAGGLGWAARDRAARQEAGARQAQEAMTAARTFFGENRLDRARRKLAEAQAQLAAHHVAPGGLTGEIEALEAELARFEQFFAWIDQAHQEEIPSPDEVALAGEGTGGTVAVLSRKPGQEREPAKAVPFLRKALALYEALGQKDWSTAPGRGALGRDQVEQIRRTAYEELLWLAEDLLARRQDHVSGEQLSAPAAARQALAYLDQAAAAHQPTTAFVSLRGRCRGALGDREAADADARLARATPPTLALDHFLLGQAALDSKKKDVAVREFEAALRLEPTHYWSLMKLGQSFIDLGEGPADFVAAVAAYTGCIMKRPDYAHAYRYRAMAHWHLKQYEKSVQDYSKAMALDPKEARDWRSRASTYARLHQYDKALADFNKATELDPKDKVAWNNRGAAYNDLHQYDKAVSDYSKAIELDPKHGVAWNNRGAAYIHLRQYDKALANLNKAIALDPMIAAAWNTRGYAYNDLHQYDKALADLNKAIELDPKNAAAWNNRGGAYSGLHQYDKALTDHTKAIELDPNRASAWNNRGKVYTELHQYDKALDDLNKAIELNPRMGAAWNNRGMAYNGLHEYKKAIDDLNKAIELDSRVAAAWNNRGFAYKELHQYEKAVADYTKANELDPKHAARWNDRGDAYYQLHQWDKAIADFSKAIELNPKFALSWNNRGSVYLLLHQDDKAIADLNKAIEHDPKLAAAWYNRGATYHDLHQYDKALADYSKAIELDPKLAAAWFNRGCAFAELGQWDKASADISKATDLSPGNAQSWYARALLRLQLGDRAGYRKVCAGMRAQFGRATSVENAYWTVSSCIQVPDTLDDWTPLVVLAEKHLAADRENFPRLTALGAALYRAGRYEEAARWLTQAESAFRKANDPAKSTASTWLFLAMAHQRLGHAEQAREWLAKAVREIDHPPAERAQLNRLWYRQLTLRLLRSEAEALLKGTRPDQPQPKGK